MKLRSLLLIALVLLASCAMMARAEEAEDQVSARVENRDLDQGRPPVASLSDEELRAAKQEVQDVLAGRRKTMPVFVARVGLAEIEREEQRRAQLRNPTPPPLTPQTMTDAQLAQKKQELQDIIAGKRTGMPVLFARVGVSEIEAEQRRRELAKTPAPPPQAAAPPPAGPYAGLSDAELEQKRQQLQAHLAQHKKDRIALARIEAIMAEQRRRGAAPPPQAAAAAPLPPSNPYLTMSDSQLAQSKQQLLAYISEHKKDRVAQIRLEQILAEERRRGVATPAPPPQAVLPSSNPYVTMSDDQLAKSKQQLLAYISQHKKDRVAQIRLDQLQAEERRRAQAKATPPPGPYARMSDDQLAREQKKLIDLLSKGINSGLARTTRTKLADIEKEMERRASHRLIEVDESGQGQDEVQDEVSAELRHDVTIIESDDE